MDTTRATLLQRVRNTDDSRSWGEFYRLYSGLIYQYARQRRLNDTDAAEVVGDCMEALSRKMRDFDYDPKRGKFRSYLRTMAQKEVAEHLRKKRPQTADTAAWNRLQADDAAPDEIWEQQWELSHLLFCWGELEPELKPLYAEAFRMVAIEESPAKDVAERLSISPNYVYQIKWRVTEQLKEKMTELVDHES